VVPLDPGVQAASPDGQMLLGYNARTDEEMVDLFNQLRIEDPQAAISETREVNGREWTIYDSPVDSTYYRTATTLIDGTNYVVFAATVGDNVQAVSEGILYPAMESFMVGDTVSAAPAEGESCPLNDLPYPRPEPDYNAKVARDLSPFQDALDAFSDEQRARLDGLLTGPPSPTFRPSSGAAI